MCPAGCRFIVLAHWNQRFAIDDCCFNEDSALAETAFTTVVVARITNGSSRMTSPVIRKTQGVTLKLRDASLPLHHQICALGGSHVSDPLRDCSPVFCRFSITRSTRAR